MFAIQRTGNDDPKSAAETAIKDKFWEDENKITAISQAVNNDERQYKTAVGELLRESGLLKELYNVAMEAKLRQDPNAFLNDSEREWKDRLTRVGRVAMERYVEARQSGLPDLDAKALMRQTAEALTKVEKTFHELEWGADKLREADRIAKAKIAFKGDRGPPGAQGPQGQQGPPGIAALPPAEREGI